MRPEVVSLRKNVHDFIRGTVLTADLTPPILEIGPMQEKWTPLKEYFVDTRRILESKSLKYISCDTDSSSEADIIADVLSLKAHLSAGSIGAIVALEVLEHVSAVWQVPEIFHSLLKPNGKLFVSVPYYFYRHAPFPDYWRISEDGLRELFSKYFELEIKPLVVGDDPRKPLQYTLVGVKK